ncbi:MAG TPA: polysaccharide biosynthesis/export family protein [Gemmataceae bacterium]|nr:polysaccharide biosynthesis/export family protein [Gemmataceae bacterium]
MMTTLVRSAPWMLLAFVLSTAGCTQANFVRTFQDDGVPRELNKVTLKEYVINPPDILLIDAVRLVPRPPYKTGPLDAIIVSVQVAGTKQDDPNRHLRPGQPIDGIYRIEPDGTINLGFDYGAAFVSGQTILEATQSIKKHLLVQFPKTDFEVRVSLGEAKAFQQIRGEHLVRPDGQVSLGTYGTVYVAGMTPEKAKAAIQEALSPKILDPEISVEIGGFNSMVYYVIFDLNGSGQHVERLPFTGNETVIDAIHFASKGLPPASDRFNMWVARPTGPEEGFCDHVLPVDWQAITRRGCAATNYQLMPGDRLYVAVDPFIEADGFLAKVIAPIERVLGIILLGNSSVRSFQSNGGNNNGN